MKRWLRIRQRIGGAAVVIVLCTSAVPCLSQSIPELETQANLGDAQAQLMLAERYASGDGVLQSHARAAELYRLAAEAGNARALNRIGAYLIVGRGVASDPVAGLAALEAAATSGDPDMIYDLAQALEAGVGGAPDLARAAALYAQAAEAGSDAAAVSLGVLYQNGTGVDPDPVRALALYQGPASRGNTRALNNSGLIYARGSGVDQDYEAAFKLLSAAAEAGMPEAMRNLAVLYQNGFGVDLDEDRANDLLRRAAEGGGSLIGLVGDPRLAPLDPEQIDIYAQAAAQGDPIGSLAFGLVLLRGGDVSGQTYRVAGQAFEAAARKGIPAAMANVGVLTFQGRGRLQDFTEGYAWLTLAGSLGLKEAIGARDVLAASMTAQQINDADEQAQALWAEIVDRGEN